jgi:hypothetical protein
MYKHFFPDISTRGLGLPLLDLPHLCYIDLPSLNLHSTCVILLTGFFVPHRCRTCRKRKTRCDGKRPLCSTCIENGHECLGYADGVETNTGKRDRKGSELGLDTGRSGYGDAEDDEDDKNANGNVNLDNRQQNSAYGSPELRRTEPRSRPYLENNSNPPLERRDMGNSAEEPDGAHGNYRESAIYDDELNPLGMLDKQQETSVS